VVLIKTGIRRKSSPPQASHGSSSGCRSLLGAINQWLRQERNERKLSDLWQAVAKMRGHFNYKDLLRLDEALSVSTVHTNALAIAQRCEAELGD
jgi:hypothetical protein